MIGIFLALLELIREKKILVEQSETLGEVQIVEAPEEHKRTYIGASLHLSDEVSADDEPVAQKQDDVPSDGKTTSSEMPGTAT